jgi:hypothetical protein
MKRRYLATVCVWTLVAPLVASAQERGRTDGPEGSEIGKGGYQDPGGGLFSLALNWGAGLPFGEPLTGTAGAPLTAGLIATFWFDDWFVMDVAPSYLFNSGRTNIFAGPRFRTMGYPISASAGLHAGAVIVPNAGVRFALSPQVGVDGLISDHFLLGLNSAFDFPLSNDPATHRVFMTLGYRF